MKFNKACSSEDFSTHQATVGCLVSKIHKQGKVPKPFRSGLKANTVAGVVTHDSTGHPAFYFIEDDSIVECFRCKVVA